MKTPQPKLILIGLAIGLVLSFLSLLYFRETTMIEYGCYGAECGTSSDTNTVDVTVRGLPFSAVVLEQDGSIKYVTLSRFIGNWLVYSVVVLIGLQFWRPKTKTV